MNFSAYIVRQRARIRERHAGETFLYTRRKATEPISVETAKRTTAAHGGAYGRAPFADRRGGEKVKGGASEAYAHMRETCAPADETERKTASPRSAQEIFDELASMQGLNASAFYCRT